jgi:hypothetical protein
MVASSHDGMLFIVAERESLAVMYARGLDLIGGVSD